MGISKPSQVMNVKHSDWRNFPVGRRRRIADRFISILLFISNFIKRKPLAIQSISFIDYLVVTGHPIPILLDVSGCHKITVSGFGSMPGNISGLSIRTNQKAVTLEFRFFGVWRSESRVIHFSGNTIGFGTDLRLDGKMPEFKTHSMVIADVNNSSLEFSTSSGLLVAPELNRCGFVQEKHVPSISFDVFSDVIPSPGLQIEFDLFDQSHFSQSTDA